METLKPSTELLQPDELSVLTLKGRTLEERHAEVCAIELNSNVPKDVRSYFATIQNLWVYGWFVYAFYGVVKLLCFICLEMALRARLPEAGEDKRSLAELLDKAICEKLINEKGFSPVRQMRQKQAQYLRRLRQITKIPKSGVPKTDYLRVLLKDLPSLRNKRFVHPRSQPSEWVWSALSLLQLTAEFINQLFPSSQ